MSKIKIIERNRSSVTGRYVTRTYAEKHPRTTVTEHDKIRVKKS